MASNHVKNNIPTIDFRNPELKPGSSQWESTKSQVFQALQEYGYFEAIYDKVPIEIPKTIFDTLEKEVIPLESKVREYFDKPFHRYDGQIHHMRYNTLEAIDLLLPESIETFSNTFWPDGNPAYCNVVKYYTTSLMELEEMVRLMVLESLGLSSYVGELCDASVFILRYTHYKAQREDGKISGLIGHKDPGFLTILKQREVGLELLNKHGEWTEVNVTPNSYIILSGDTCKAWTNGRVQSPTHRVIMKGNIDRFGMQLFSSPIPGYIVETPKELVDDEHPLLFKPYDINEYYKYVASGSKNGYGLKAYCGI